MLTKSKIKKAILLLKLKLKEKIYQGRLKYVLENNSSDTLVIIFSAFSPRPVYNYMYTLEKLRNADKLYILDDFGYKGSYYWYENGHNTPLILVKSLIQAAINRMGYKNLVTIGSSKGGTCAIYYGLMFGAQHIFAGACQYYVGNYLSDKPDILNAMMGETNEVVIAKLNDMMPAHLRQHKGSTSLIHLLYSPNENTYDKHIIYLLADLKKYGIPFEEIIDNFKDHNDVGKPFSHLLSIYFGFESSGRSIK
ncbi:MAG: hypothetical protein J5661_05345 [Bacteroidaceae bacterium]|nr:hypothetical protein [Bacteroidaceae bacterium]